MTRNAYCLLAAIIVVAAVGIVSANSPAPTTAQIEGLKLLKGYGVYVRLENGSLENPWKEIANRLAVNHGAKPIDAEHMVVIGVNAAKGEPKAEITVTVDGEMAVDGSLRENQFFCQDPADRKAGIATTNAKFAEWLLCHRLR